MSADPPNCPVLIERLEELARENARLVKELAAARAQLTALTTAPVELSEEQARALKAYAAEVNADAAKYCLVVGKVYRHPESNRLLRVTGGSFFGREGRVSNYWWWSYLAYDFSLAGQIDHGYGWAAKPVEEPQS